MDLTRELFDAIRDKSDAKVSDLLEKMTAKEVNKKHFGWTALHQACKRNNAFATQKLLAFPGIHVNVRNNLGCTPLLMVGMVSPSSFKGCVSRIKRVLNLMLDDPRVDLNSVSKDGATLEDTFGKHKNKEAKQYLNILKMIKDAKRGRENKPVEKKKENFEDDALEMETDLEKVTTNVKIQYNYIEKIEKTNKDIEAGEKRFQENEEIRKGKIKDMQEKEDLELKAVGKGFDQEIDIYRQIKLKLEQQLAEVQELMTKTKDKKAKTLEEIGIRHNGLRAVLYNECKLEHEEEQKYLSQLKEMKKQLSQDLKRHSSNDVSGMEDARGTLECPICMESMKPPTRIWMCQSTHLICEPCKDKLDWWKVCPTCRTGGVTLRAFMAENFARTIFPAEK